ncbi:MAG: hypothetical protein ACT6RN_05085 [Agrobacterium sp.]|uniref:hypothetical protein n=1 Tax=Agrobacterium sp. TaxID=361 RepID=UPI0040340F44
MAMFPQSRQTRELRKQWFRRDPASENAVFPQERLLVTGDPAKNFRLRGTASGFLLLLGLAGNVFGIL